MDLGGHRGVFVERDSEEKREGKLYSEYKFKKKNILKCSLSTFYLGLFKTVHLQHNQ